MGKSSFPPSLFENDCDRPACADTVSALNAALNQTKNKLSNQNTNTIDNDDTEIVECPPTSSELGRGSWNLLHSMAAWYPDQPTDEDQKAMKRFFEGLAKFYPCTYCAEDFQMNLLNKPVKTESRKDLSQWLCEQHNFVNKKLGKSQYPCDMKSLDERWRVSTDTYCNEDPPRRKKEWKKIKS